MNAERTNRLIDRYKSGLLSACEVANDQLFELVYAPEIDTRFLSSIESLPDEVRQEFFRLLQRIREADYLWIPPLITAPSDSRPDPTEYSAKLRQVIAFLSQRGSLAGIHIDN